MNTQWPVLAVSVFQKYKYCFEVISCSVSSHSLSRSPFCEEIVCCRGDHMRLAVRVRVFVYPENACAVWLMFACKYLSVLWPTDGQCPATTSLCCTLTPDFIPLWGHSRCVFLLYRCLHVHSIRITAVMMRLNWNEVVLIDKEICGDVCCPFCSAQAFIL